MTIKWIKDLLTKNLVALILVTCALLYIAPGLTSFNFNADEYRVLMDVDTMSFGEYMESKPGYSKVILAHTWIATNIFGHSIYPLKITSLVVILLFIFYLAKFIHLSTSRTVSGIFVTAVTVAIFLYNEHIYYYFRWGMVSYNLCFLLSLSGIYYIAASIKDGNVGGVNLYLFYASQLIASSAHLGLFIFFVAVHCILFVNDFLGYEDRLQPGTLLSAVRSRIVSSIPLFLGLAIYFMISMDQMYHIEPRQSMKAYSFPHSSFANADAGLWLWTQSTVANMFGELTEYFSIRNKPLLSILPTYTLVLTALATVFVAFKNRLVAVLVGVFLLTVCTMWVLGVLGYYRFGNLRYALFLNPLLVSACGLSLFYLMRESRRLHWLIKPTIFTVLGGLMGTYSLLAYSNVTKLNNNLTSRQNQVIEDIAILETALKENLDTVILYDNQIRVYLYSSAPNVLAAGTTMGFSRDRNEPLSPELIAKLQSENTTEVHVITRYPFVKNRYKEAFDIINANENLIQSNQVGASAGFYTLFTNSSDQMSNVKERFFAYKPRLRDDKLRLQLLIISKTKIDTVKAIVPNSPPIVMKSHIRHDVINKNPDWPSGAIYGFATNLPKDTDTTGVKYVITYLNGTVEERNGDNRK